MSKWSIKASNGEEINDFSGVEELELGVRASNGLRAEGFKTVGQVRRTPDADLLRIPNFGRISLNEVRSLAPYTDEPMPVSRPARNPVSRFRACGRCQHWRATGGSYGECRRDPPKFYARLLSENTEPIRGWVATRFPVTKHEDWCGEYAAEAGTTPLDT